MQDRLTQSSIAGDLQAMGLTTGDIVILHSALSSMGSIQGGADAVIDAFLEVLGNQGTLVVPTFGDLGIITKTVAQRPDAIKSIHPKASVAAIGKHAEEICRDHWKADTAHGENTPYTRIADLNGYIFLLGVDQDRNTTLHTVEALLRLPYLDSTKETTFQTPEGEITKSWDFFPGPHRDFISLDKLFRDSGKMRISRIGNAAVRMIKSRDLIELAMQQGRKDPGFVLCRNPHCQDCVNQRARIRRHTFNNEAFTLTASSGLAGYYVPEIIRNLKTMGIDAVELDYIEGVAAHTLPKQKLTDAISEIMSNGCKITALRIMMIPDDLDAIMATAMNNMISRIVIPLSFHAPRHAERAKETGVHISFNNSLFGSRTTFDIMRKTREAYSHANLTFSGSGFVRCSEKPFLISYRNKLARFIDQLDVEDLTRDNRQQPLGHGHAEIHELVSILRCRHFNGTMLLAYGNKIFGDLKTAVTDFESLLQSI